MPCRPAWPSPESEQAVLLQKQTHDRFAARNALHGLRKQRCNRELANLVALRGSAGKGDGVGDDHFIQRRAVGDAVNGGTGKNGVRAVGVNLFRAALLEHFGGFDERADLAAERLIDYLKRYMKKSEKGADDPMYQMAMTLLERNKAGDLDYKSISKLYELEDKFDSEYGEIMSLFKEANVVQKNAVNYYFSKRNPETNVWRRIEPSFCRM